MSITLLTLEIHFEQDIVMTRQRTRQLAQMLGFESQDQTRLATAVSEVARNVFQYNKVGKVEFRVEGTSTQIFQICIRDTNPTIPNTETILDGQYKSDLDTSSGILGAKRLMEQFQIESIPGQGTNILIGKPLPKRSSILTKRDLAEIADKLILHSPQNPYEEIQQQNQELLRTLEALRKREEELTQLNQELEDTNRGVVALYAELDEKATSLKRANELKTRFLSNMSHEFRTPLNSIISLSRLLLERTDGELTLDQEKQVTFIRKNAEQLSELVNDLLDLAKVEAGKVVVHPTQFEVSDLFATLRGMLRPLLIHNSSISLTFQETKNFPPLYTDEAKVAQILRNFISNALKYTERGEIKVEAAIADNAISFSVTDTGIGIAPEDKERIFEEFVQIESSLQKRVKGTGLGLPLSRKLAELLGGSVWVTSQLGIGSKFYTSIPIRYPGALEEQFFSLPINLQKDPTRAAVLAVEDDPQTIFTYEKYFEDSIYQLVTVQTLSQAQQVLQAFNPIVIMLDILLKEQNTWAFLTELKENQRTQNIPIVVVSVVNNEAKAKALGANAFFIKPVDRLLLLNQINMLVKQGKPQKLLLIDDDPAFRYVLKQVLSDCTSQETLALQITEANDGSEGIRLARVESPDCIIMDISIPVVNGFEVLSLLKSNVATQDIQVIIYTLDFLDEEDRKNLAQSTIAILSKEATFTEVEIHCLKETLVKAGLALMNVGERYV
ncbi:ATP-binding protein [Scytonema sp. NUACC26]|uniref:ATP-binding protein n=1 Tax=Scytonema sp. NUACC26 TaxID=3140176 RepID=UPI0034DBE96E